MLSGGLEGTGPSITHWLRRPCRFPVAVRFRTFFSTQCAKLLSSSAKSMPCSLATVKFRTLPRTSSAQQLEDHCGHKALRRPALPAASKLSGYRPVVYRIRTPAYNHEPGQATTSLQSTHDFRSSATSSVAAVACAAEIVRSYQLPNTRSTYADHRRSAALLGASVKQGACGCPQPLQPQCDLRKAYPDEGVSVVR